MKLNNFPAIFKVGSTQNFKPPGSMLRNLFGSHVPSDLLLFGDARSTQIKKNWRYVALTYQLADCHFHQSASGKLENY
jgi:hypothetical protein